MLLERLLKIESKYKQKAPQKAIQVSKAATQYPVIRIAGWVDKCKKVLKT